MLIDLDWCQWLSPNGYWGRETWRQLPVARNASVTHWKTSVATILLGGTDADWLDRRVQADDFAGEWNPVPGCGAHAGASADVLYSYEAFYFVPAANFNGTTSFAYSVQTTRGRFRVAGTAVIRITPRKRCAHDKSQRPRPWTTCPTGLPTQLPVRERRRRGFRQLQRRHASGCGHQWWKALRSAWDCD
jgi:hypothetical protein